MKIASFGKIYSFNEANRWDWDEPLQDYATDIQQGLVRYAHITIRHLFSHFCQILIFLKKFLLLSSFQDDDDCEKQGLLASTSTSTLTDDEVDEEGTTKKRSAMKKDKVKNKNKRNDPTETEIVVGDGKILNGEGEKTILRPSAVLLLTSPVQERKIITFNGPWMLTNSNFNVG